LYIDDNGGVIVLFSPLGCGDGHVCFQASVGTAAVVGSCHYHFTFECFYGVVYAFVIGGNE
jgi:hypothetical protein